MQLDVVAFLLPICKALVVYGKIFCKSCLSFSTDGKTAMTLIHSNFNEIQDAINSLKSPIFPLPAKHLQGWGIQNPSMSDQVSKPALSSQNYNWI